MPQSKVSCVWGQAFRLLEILFGFEACGSEVENWKGFSAEGCPSFEVCTLYFLDLLDKESVKMTADDVTANKTVNTKPTVANATASLMSAARLHHKTSGIYVCQAISTRKDSSTCMKMVHLVLRGPLKCEPPAPKPDTELENCKNLLRQLSLELKGVCNQK